MQRGNINGMAALLGSTTPDDLDHDLVHHLAGMVTQQQADRPSYPLSHR